MASRGPRDRWRSQLLIKTATETIMAVEYAHYRGWGLWFRDLITYNVHYHRALIWKTVCHSPSYYIFGSLILLNTFLIRDTRSTGNKSFLKFGMWIPRFWKKSLGTYYKKLACNQCVARGNKHIKISGF